MSYVHGERPRDNRLSLDLLRLDTPGYVIEQDDGLDAWPKRSMVSAPRTSGFAPCATARLVAKNNMKTYVTCILLAMPWVAYSVVSAVFSDSRVVYMTSMQISEFFPRFVPPLIGCFLAPILGAASDRSLSKWGRRNVFLVTAALFMITFGILYGSAKKLFPTHRAIVTFVFFMLNLGFVTFDISLRARIMDVVPLEFQVHAQAAVAFWAGIGALSGMLLFRDGKSLASEDSVKSDEMLVAFSTGAAVVLVFTLLSIYLRPEHPQATPSYQPPLQRLVQEAWEQILYAPKLFRFLCVLYFVLYFAWWSFRDQIFVWWGKDVYLGCRGASCTADERKLYEDGITAAMNALICQNALQSLICVVFLFSIPRVSNASYLNRVSTFGLGIGSKAIASQLALTILLLTRTLGKYCIPVAFGAFVAIAFYHSVVFIFPFSVVGIMGKEMQESEHGFNNNGLFVGVLTLFQSIAELTVQVYGTKKMAPLGTGNVMALSCVLFAAGAASTAAFKFGHLCATPTSHSDDDAGHDQVEPRGGVAPAATQATEAADHPMVLVHLKFIHRERISLQCESDILVAELKSRVLAEHTRQERANASTDQPNAATDDALGADVALRLIYKGKVLKDDHTLASYHFVDGDTIHVVVGRPPAANANGNANATTASAASPTAAAALGGQASSAPPTSQAGTSSGTTSSVFVSHIDVGAGDSVPDIGGFINSVLQNFGGGVTTTVNIHNVGANANSSAASSTRSATSATSSAPSEHSNSLSSGASTTPSPVTSASSSQHAAAIPFAVAVPTPAVPSPAILNEAARVRRMLPALELMPLSRPSDLAMELYDLGNAVREVSDTFLAMHRQLQFLSTRILHDNHLTVSERVRLESRVMQLAPALQQVGGLAMSLSTALASSPYATRAEPSVAGSTAESSSPGGIFTATAAPPSAASASPSARSATYIDDNGWVRAAHPIGDVMNVLREISGSFAAQSNAADNPPPTNIADGLSTAFSSISAFTNAVGQGSRTPRTSSSTNERPAQRPTVSTSGQTATVTPVAASSSSPLEPEPAASTSATSITSTPASIDDLPSRVPSTSLQDSPAPPRAPTPTPISPASASPPAALAPTPAATSASFEAPVQPMPSSAVPPTSPSYSSSPAVSAATAIPGASTSSSRPISSLCRQILGQLSPELTQSQQSSSMVRQAYPVLRQQLQAMFTSENPPTNKQIWLDAAVREVERAVKTTFEEYEIAYTRDSVREHLNRVILEHFIEIACSAYPQESARVANEKQMSKLLSKFCGALFLEITELKEPMEALRMTSAIISELLSSSYSDPNVMRFQTQFLSQVSRQASTILKRFMAFQLALCFEMATADNPLELPPGQYYRPHPPAVSGLPSQSTEFARAPCPALNTLANLGYIHRSGHDIRRDDLRRALREVYGLSTGLTWVLSSKVPPVFKLSDLTVHNDVEHDVSLFRQDVEFQQDQSVIDPQLVDLFNSTMAGKQEMDESDFLQYHLKRWRDSRARNPTFTFGWHQQLATYGEIRLVLRVLGSRDQSRDYRVKTDDVRTFFLEERLPSSYVRSHKSVELGTTYRCLITASITCLGRATASLFVLHFALCFVSAMVNNPLDLPLGQYYRPQPPAVTGLPSQSTEFARAPCPALNTLANLGYIHRSGHGIRRDDLRRALREVYGLSKSLTWALSTNVPKVFKLSELTTHNEFEHDVSLFRQDAEFQQDQSVIDPQLVDLFNSTMAGKQEMDESDFLQFHLKRWHDSRSRNPTFTFGLKQQLAIYGEMRLVLQLLGSSDQSGAYRVKTDDIRTFFFEERLPSSYVLPPKSIGLRGIALKTSTRMTRSAVVVALCVMAALATMGTGARMLRAQPNGAASATLAMATTFWTDNTTGEYIRPKDDEMSGVPNNTARYHRSPCPGLNTLANHGYLPRDGKNLTPAIIKHAIMQVYNLEDSLAERLASALPPTLTLADLGQHGFIEHDASLVHDDAFFRHDPAHVNATLVQQLLSRADHSGRLTPAAVAHFRAQREDDCARTDPEYSFGVKQQVAAYAEAAALLLVIGNYDSELLPVENARSFLVEEKLPTNYTKPREQVTLTTALWLSTRLKVLSRWPFGAAALE
ncbi:TPA: hypothetical protein N0F65_004743 [Lagenidium giganteum]|uniref:Ubiquitin-like domain-containing protein n=1 Tax=Lagenidium giganteum TaxID=4803 RepID=A0AAV2YIZ1_9STRA|nr:TPA: hypothetical protein N0F65_004743 [Lagenidium giganteum]